MLRFSKDVSKGEYTRCWYIEDMREELGLFLQKKGFQIIPSNLPEFTIYCVKEAHFINVIHVIDYQKNLYLVHDQYTMIQKEIENLFPKELRDDIHMLSLVLCEDENKVKNLCAEDSFCWMIKPESKNLVIFDDKVSDYYGLKGQLTEWLKRPEVEWQKDRIAIQTIANQTNQIANQKKKNMPIITIILLAINVALFLLCTMTGSLLYNMGELYGPYVVENGQYYRLFTAMFLHVNVDHLFGNMIILYGLGEIVEREFGAIRYLFLYFLSGICGGMMSIAYGNLINQNYASLGASGAIFGVVGALFFLVLLHKGKYQEISYGRIVFLICYSLYSGFTGTNIDNAAHIGGLLSGIAWAACLWFLPGRRGKHI